MEKAGGGRKTGAWHLVGKWEMGCVMGGTIAVAAGVRGARERGVA